MPASLLCPDAAFPPDAWATTLPTGRVAGIRTRLLTETRRVDLERARITTESYRCTEGAAMPIRRAVMLHDLARRTSIAIYEGERIVGNRSLLPRMGIIAPEGAVDWIDRELEILPTRPQDRFDITLEEIETLRRDVFPYWRGKTLEDTVAARVPEHIRRAVKARAFSLNQTDHAQGHILPDVESWLRLGIGGLRAHVQAGALRSASDPHKAVFYEAAGIALDAAALFMRRCARLAARMAREEVDPLRRRELREIAARCRWLAEHPARDFRDALQVVWFLFVLLQMESNASSFSPGRLDQYLLPYLEADLASGALTLDAAQEWLELLWLKFNEIVLLRSSASARYFAGFPIGFNVILGGQTPGGEDATNLLSFMCLRAQADVGLTQPNLSIRIHRDSPQPFLRAAASVIGRGGGMPQVFNDEVIIPGQIRRGVDPDDARDYAVVGCVELSVPGKALGWSDASMFNMTRVLELTLFGGRDPAAPRVEVGVEALAGYLGSSERPAEASSPDLADGVEALAGYLGSGERPAKASSPEVSGPDDSQIGLPTPRLDEMPDFAALEAAYDAQLAHFVALMAEGCAIVDRIHAELLPSPFLSLVVKDCLGRGVDVTAGGARYNFSGVQGVQVANVADSLAAVKQAVFDDGWLSAAQLLEALRCNYEGTEQWRQRLIHRAPKFGNDDDRADAFAARWADRYSELVASYPTARGGTYQPGFYTVSAHVPMGAHVGATPDGRKAGEPLADGGLSPASGRDRRGPTAVLRSVGKIDLELASNGALLNMKFLPSFFQGEAALDSFVDLLRGFSALKIPHVQFNVVSAETLRRAQARPEEYRGLVVRVAGYSAYFTELDRALQDEIIARTEFDET